MLKTLRKWLLCLYLIPIANGLETPCADMAQRCATVVEEFERHIEDVKSLAFRNCFSKNACIQERLVFDDCYSKSIKAVRAPFNGNDVPNDEFFDSAERYRNQLEQCFHGSDTASKPDASSLLIDEDAIYGRMIYGNEYADRLWDLQEYGLEKPMLDPHDACLVKGHPSRVFGSGISRIIDSASPLINNLNNSCTLETEELLCFRHFLDQDNQFREMLKNRDRALRSCIQDIRSQRKCRTNHSSKLRSCICNAREELENKILKELLACVKKSPLAQIYSTIINMSENDQGPPFRVYAAAPPRKTNSGNSKERNDPSQVAAADDPSSGSSMSITQGVVLNGQCLCACPGAVPPTLFGSTPSRQFSTDSGASIPTVIGTPAISQPAVDMTTIQQQKLQQQWEKEQRQLQQEFQRKQTQLYQQQVYQQQPTGGMVNLITGPTKSIESGIGDGFERFFQGMPPIRRRDLSSQRRISNF